MSKIVLTALHCVFLIDRVVGEEIFCWDEAAEVEISVEHSSCWEIKNQHNINKKWYQMKFKIRDASMNKRLTRCIAYKNEEFFYTSTKLWMGYIFTTDCLCVCLSVCVSDSACEQNSSRTDALIWTRFLPNGCLVHWLGHYRNWWPWVKSQGHSGSKWMHRF